MEAYAPGDRVHIVSLGVGIVREVRNGGRYLVEVKGHALVVTTAQLERARARRPVREETGRRDAGEPTSASIVTLDLHGQTAADAVETLDRFLNDALLAGATGARIIHGRSGGKLKAAVHARLKQLPSVQAFRLDPRNPGVTVVRL